MIRFGHRVSFASLMIASVQAGRAPSDPLIAWRKNVQKLPEEAREQILAVHSEVSDAFSKQLIGGSIVLSLFVVLRVFIAAVKASLMLLEGKKDPRNFNLSRVRIKVDWERNQIAKSGTNMIEARVLHEEQRRASIKSDHAYAH